MSGNGNPSAIATIFLVEHVLLLAKRGQEGGVPTPAAALGDDLGRGSKSWRDAADEAPAVAVERDCLCVTSRSRVSWRARDAPRPRRFASVFQSASTIF